MSELFGGRLVMTTNPTNALRYIKYVFYIRNLLCLLHVAVTLMAVFREVRYRGWTYRDITEICEPMHGCEVPYFKNTCFKIHIEF